jgi:hypothetical protein
MGAAGQDRFDGSATADVHRFRDPDRSNDGAEGCVAQGRGSGIRMIQYFINRGGSGLSPTRRAKLERAKRILQRRAARRKTARKRP